MLKLVFVALFCAQAFARPSGDLPFESHVVGGTPATEGQFPYIVSLRQVGSNQFFCGGALISNRYILTAAHCVKGKGPSQIVIGAGSINLGSQKTYSLDRVIPHPSYNDKTMFNDIAILRLTTPITLGGNVQTIAYPSNEQLDGKTVTAMGWGKTSQNGPPSSRLLFLNKPILPNSACQSRLNTKIGPGQICLGSEVNYGMCFGDSGSPLVYKGADGKTYVVGVVSWGIPCAKGYPDVFTRVSHYTSWIQQNMN